MDVRANMINSRSGEPLIAAHQDFITAAWLLTQRDVLLDRDAVCQAAALIGDATEPVDLPKLRAAVGASATHEVTVSNPVGEELPLQLRVEGRNPKAFTLQGPKTGPGGAGALLLPPYGELTCTLTYTPSALDEEQSAMLALTHPKLGEWLYRAKGMGHAPSDMPVTRTGTRRRVRSPCETHSTSRSSSTLRSSSR
jgi:hypothetical protein